MSIHIQEIRKALAKREKISVREIGKEQIMEAYRYAGPDIGKGTLEENTNLVMCEWPDPKGWIKKDLFNISDLEIVI